MNVNCYDVSTVCVNRNEYMSNKVSYVANNITLTCFRNFSNKFFFVTSNKMKRRRRRRRQ